MVRTRGDKGYVSRQLKVDNFDDNHRCRDKPSHYGTTSSQFRR